MLNTKFKAFTLVELLVSMAIISVLIGLAIGAVSVAQRVSRDSQRRGGLQELSAYIGEYAASNDGDFPPLGGASGLRLSGNNILLGSGASLKTITLQGPAKAASSTSSTQTRYCYNSSANGYVLGARLEDGTWELNLSTDRATANLASTPTNCDGAWGIL